MIERHFHDVYFNGKSLADFGVHVSGTGVFNGPEEDYESVEIPGRNGDLHIFNGRFKNVELTYKAWIAGDRWVPGEERQDFIMNVRQFRNHMLKSRGYQRLEDTYHPDEYRFAMFKGPFTTEPIMLQAGEFDLTFDCKPQRYLKLGEKKIELKKTGNINNPTDFDALPFIRVYGYGSLQINDTIITISSTYSNPYMDIDCEIQDCFYGKQNANPYVNLVDGEFFALKPGINTITLPSRITKVELTPRWWIL